MPITYTMEAKENYSDALLTEIASEFSWTTFTHQAFVGDNFDFVRREFLYASTVRISPDPTYDYSVWDGSVEIPPDTEVNSRYYQNFRTLRKPINTGTVTDFIAFDPAELVPAGIGGGDGTWARYVDTDAEQQRQLRRVVDPLTGDYFQHTYGVNYPCGLYRFSRTGDYLHTISPLQSDGHMEILGLTADWLYVHQDVDAVTQTMSLVPRLVTSDEVTADYLLSYADFTWPAAANPASAYSATSIDFDGNAWVLTRTRTGSRAYTLQKFTPPTSAPYGGPVVGGGFTDKTPWGSGAGPENGASTYTLDGAPDHGGAENTLINLHMQRTGGDQFLALITKLVPADKTLNSRDPSLMRWDCTTYNIADDSSTTYEGWLTGYLDADLNPVETVGDAYYVLIDAQYCNSFLDRSDYDFGSLDDLYCKRWFFLTVQKVVEGAWSYDVNENHTVIAQWAFSELAAPSLVVMYDEDLWFSAYSYTGYDHPMNKCMAALDLNTNAADGVYETGLWDEATQSWYWGGAQGTSGSSPMGVLDTAFSDRSMSTVSAPFLRIGLAPAARRMIGVRSYVAGPNG